MPPRRITHAAGPTRLTFQLLAPIHMPSTMLPPCCHPTTVLHRVLCLAACARMAPAPLLSRRAGASACLAGMLCPPAMALAIRSWTRRKPWCALTHRGALLPACWAFADGVALLKEMISHAAMPCLPLLPHRAAHTPSYSAHPPPNFPTGQATESSEPLYFWQVAGEVLRTNPKQSLADPLRSQLGQLGLSPLGGFNAEALPPKAEAALAHAAPVAAAFIEARFVGICLGSRPPAQPSSAAGQLATNGSWLRGVVQHLRPHWPAPF